MRVFYTRTYERAIRKLLPEDSRVEMEAAMVAPRAIYLLTAYAKSDRDDLTSTDIKAFSTMVATIKRDGREK